MMMLDTPRVERITDEIVRRYLPADSVIEVTTRPTSDSVDGEALQVKIVIKEEALDGIVRSGAALDLLSQLQRTLRENGEDRFASVNWLTDADLVEFAKDDIAR